MIRRSPWPAFTHMSWLLKSMKRRPSTVWKRTPLALAIGIGLMPAWADQSYSVCRRQSSVISSALSGFTTSVCNSALGRLGSRSGPQGHSQAEIAEDLLAHEEAREYQHDAEELAQKEGPGDAEPVEAAGHARDERAERDQESDRHARVETALEQALHGPRPPGPS